jgi:hypothetical protein
VRDTITNTYRYVNSNSNAASNSYRHGYRQCYGYTKFNYYPHGYRNGNADSNRNRYSNSDCYTNCDGYAHAHAECYADSDSYPYSQPNPHFPTKHNTEAPAHPAAETISFIDEEETRCSTPGSGRAYAKNFGVRPCPP